MRVRLTQLTDDLNDAADREDLVAGPGGKGATRYYAIPAGVDQQNADDILDWFHSTVPIGCLEDFDVEIVPDTFRWWFIFGTSIELRTTKHIHCAEYDTEAELQAFCAGVEHMDGYAGYDSYDTEEEAIQEAESAEIQLRLIHSDQQLNQP